MLPSAPLPAMKYASVAARAQRGLAAPSAAAHAAARVWDVRRGACPVHAGLGDTTRDSFARGPQGDRQRERRVRQIAKGATRDDASGPVPRWRVGARRTFLRVLAGDAGDDLEADFVVVRAARDDHERPSVAVLARGVGRGGGLALEGIAESADGHVHVPNAAHGKSVVTTTEISWPSRHVKKERGRHHRERQERQARHAEPTVAPRRTGAVERGAALRPPRVSGHY